METGPALSSQERTSVSLQQKLVFRLGDEHSLRLCSGKRGQGTRLILMRERGGCQEGRENGAR